MRGVHTSNSIPEFAHRSGSKPRNILHVPITFGIWNTVNAHVSANYDPPLGAEIPHEHPVPLNEFFGP